MSMNKDQKESMSYLAVSLYIYILRTWMKAPAVYFCKWTKTVIECSSSLERKQSQYLVIRYKMYPT